MKFQEEKEDIFYHKAQMELMRKKRRAQFKEVIKQFRELGFTVEEVAPRQIRFNDCLDILPDNKCYHDLIKNVRGEIRDRSYFSFLKEHFSLK